MMLKENGTGVTILLLNLCKYCNIIVYVEALFLTFDGPQNN